jgi:hypothetical protein
VHYNIGFWWWFYGITRHWAWFLWYYSDVLSRVFLRHPRSCFLCFFGNPYISPFDLQNFYFIFWFICSTVYYYKIICYAFKQSFTLSKKRLLVRITWGIKCTYVGRAWQPQGAEYDSSYIILLCTAKHVARMQLPDPSFNFLWLLPMILGTRSLSTFLRGSFVAEPSLLGRLHKHTVLVKSEHKLHDW